ncbi:MAG: hypothetical protein U0176_11525, partial [Bacteroidia bacterium]
CNGIHDVHIHGGANTAWPPCSSKIPPDTTAPPPSSALLYPAITVTLYPNPADDHVWMRITPAQTAAGDERYRFILRDMLGKELVSFSGLVEGDNWLQLPRNLAVASYFWHVLPEVRVGTRHRLSGGGVVLVGR